MDALEELTMARRWPTLTTRCEVERVFPLLLFENDEHVKVKVLYPAIESTLWKERRMKQRSSGDNGCLFFLSDPLRPADDVWGVDGVDAARPSVL